MQRRPLGRSGLQVAPLALGCNVFGWTADERTSFALLDAWTEAGGNLIDTADVYSTWAPGHVGGESETLIGRWIAQGGGRRERIVLATKVGKPMGPGRQGLSAAYIRDAVEASLRRLRTDRIDLYQSHDDDERTPLAETLGAYAELIRAGKVRAIGASNYSAARLLESLRVSAEQGLPRYESLQPLYNPIEREPFEAGLEAVCLEQGVGVINFYGLAAGFLTGKYRRPEDAGLSPRGANVVKRYLNARGLAVLAALDAVAARHACPPGRVALAWQIARPAITAPIASATSLAQLDELVAAAQLVLTAEDSAQIDAASAWR
ncbi:MAG: aldo/keto reductase [Burkholderiales bacterium]|nr:aldo/keto reductase [Burkholderiales bacterium]MDE1927959.1 aldo/keto reductase [Burkholderiales bacterium]MDE2157456.1 aldo/keto reductase [Burkholderiales bacterium]MDE2501753.1 aldo/keto reductase [Burkholderiales bacterium]